jgi:hypothetical protein|tara:strand:- start:260 stop:520 length:261 start_codon:yes stop_codon:yes gene_type:complete
MSEPRIIHTQGGTMFSGREAVEVVALITLKHGIAFEASTGMKMTRGPSCRSIARKRYGIKGGAEKQIEQLEKLIETTRGAIEEVIE